MSAQRIIERYYQSWVDDDREAVREVLAEDVKFRSPTADCDGADAFLQECWDHSEGFDRFDVVHAVYGELSGYVAYRAGSFCCGEFVRVADGRITEIYVTFDPTVE